MLENVIVVSLLCFGVKFVTSEGELLSFVREWSEVAISFLVGMVIKPYYQYSHIQKGERYITGIVEKVTETILKPIFLCVYCMASVWSIIYLKIYGIDVMSIDTLVFMLCVCGVNIFLSSIIELSENLKEFVKYS